MKSKRSLKRKNPWKRVPVYNDDYYKSEDVMHYIDNLADKHPKFLQNKNTYLNVYTKRAALAASPFVVALISYSDEMELRKCSGTIIAIDDDNTGIVFTSANLISSGRNSLHENLKVEVKLSDGKSCEGKICAYDFHLNIAAIRFESDSPISTPTLRRLDDSLNLDLPEHKSSQIQCHSRSIKLSPGGGLVALGRYFAKPFDLMAAPGVYSVGRCKYDCKELLMSTCKITKCGDGGPIVNQSGKIIGITFYDRCFTPFIPINVAYKWWEIYKRDGEPRRPSLGMEATNFYTASLWIAEKIIQKFPSISKGVIVEKVIPGSSADTAGLLLNDVIIQCAGKPVQSFLEYLEIIWDHIGHPVELVVARANHITLSHLKMMVTGPTLEELNSWPRW